MWYWIFWARCIYIYIIYLYIYVISILISFRCISLKEELPSHLLYWFSFILWMNVTWMEIWLSTNMFVCFLISYVTYILFVLLHFIYIPWSLAFEYRLIHTHNAFLIIRYTNAKNQLLHILNTDNILLYHLISC